jgi:hypothetical protein
METTLLAVNGTLMRGLERNSILVDVGGSFVREDETEGCYRIWSIGDRHPAMMRTPGIGTSVPVEVWEVPFAALGAILEDAPPGLAIGKVVLKDGSVVLGVLGEPFLCYGQPEITEFGGWRAYIATQQLAATA